MMIRCTLLVTCFAVSLLSMGCCCGPMQCGTGRAIPARGGDWQASPCNECGDPACGGVCGNMPYSPLDGLRRMRRNLTCGVGCGETYYGEWTSTPPDCSDPCCDDQWVGGAAPCRPFCWQPGMFLSRLYGSRYCDGTQSACGCDGACDGSCENDFGGGYIEGGYIEGGYIEGEFLEGETIEGASVIGNSTSTGCASCDAKNARMARRVPATDNLTRTMNAPYNRVRR